MTKVKSLPGAKSRKERINSLTSTFMSDAEQVTVNRERLAYNEDCRNVVDPIEGDLYGSFVVIRLFKVTFDENDKGGLEIPQFTLTETDGGRPTAQIRDFTYTDRGVIHAIGNDMSEKYKDLKVGDEVLVAKRFIKPEYVFDMERMRPVLNEKDVKGYFLLPSHAIEYRPKPTK